MENKGYQEKHWQNFYEDAWLYRSKFMEECIGQGLNAYQAINKLQQKERKYYLTKTDSGMTWLKREFDEKNVFSTGTPFTRTSSFRGKFVEIPYYTEVSAADMIADTFENDGNDYDAIIELGCGYGRNLFEIFYKHKLDVKYFGGEFTESGVNICRKLATTTPDMDSEFFHFNHLEPELNIGEFNKILVYTVHTIEQVKLIPDNWFNVVSNAAPYVKCIHIEPFGFQCENLGQATEQHRAFFQKNGWNLNFAEKLQQAHINKEINVEYVSTEIFLPNDPANPSSFAVWCSDKR